MGDKSGRIYQAVIVLLVAGFLVIFIHERRTIQRLISHIEAVEETTSPSTEQQTVGEGVYGDLTVKEDTLIIPGLQREYRFLYLTDMHTAVMTHTDLGKQFGDARNHMNSITNINGTAASEQFVQWIEYANEQQVDAFLMGGDMIDYYSPTNEQFLCDCVKQLKMPYVYAIGNHEEYSPWGESVPYDSPLHQLFDNCDPSFQMLELDELIICSVRDEGYFVDIRALDGMKEAIAIGKPIIILVHVPLYNDNAEDLMEQSIQYWGTPLVTGPGALGDFASTNEFLDMILAEDSNVVAVWAGDNHMYYRGQLSNQVQEWVFEPAFSGVGTLISVRGERE